MKSLHECPEYIAELDKLRALKAKVNELDAREREFNEKVRPIHGSSSNADAVTRALAVANGDTNAAATAVDLQRLEAERNTILRGIQAQEQIIADTERRLSDRALKELEPRMREIIAKEHRHAQALVLTNGLVDELRADYEAAGYRVNRMPYIGLFSTEEAIDLKGRCSRYLREADEQLAMHGIASPKAKAKAA